MSLLVALTPGSIQQAHHDLLLRVEGQSGVKGKSESKNQSWMHLENNVYGIYTNDELDNSKQHIGESRVLQVLGQLERDIRFRKATAWKSQNATRKSQMGKGGSWVTVGSVLMYGYEEWTAALDKDLDGAHRLSLIWPWPLCQGHTWDHYWILHIYISGVPYWWFIHS